ncbi:hypothetical protein O181_032230 [Austropuccinia psidii MF-1]|uniref:Retrotransposon gag domain-containing protein n=1 Tax=Austropuccinia psidii MF-1 TaxID=1389203 RepID=A0A9Q3D0N0_9BASI|nr:hypothetical protein [Austropuccinia psidii MF-1]
MKAPECLYGTQPFKSNFYEDRKKSLYATSFLIGRAETWIEPYLSNITNQDPEYLLNDWALFESQLFILFGDPDEVRQSEAELDASRLKEGGHVLLYISYFIALTPGIGDWGERALFHHFRKELASRIIDQLAVHPSRFDSLQNLMDISLELDTRYHERKKENNNFQLKKSEASKSVSSHPQTSSN